MHSLAPYFGTRASKWMLYGSSVVSKSTLSWISNYARKSSFENFKPHITLGFGKAEIKKVIKLKFKAQKLAICHLGNHCTCRRVLGIVKIKG
jgi:hypothetical protein